MLDEQLKDRILIALSILTVMCLVLAISASLASSKSKRALQKEMILRMENEEKLSTLTPKMDSVEAQLKNAQANIDGLNKQLEDQNLINKELGRELKEMTELKKVLEKNLKETLARCRQ
ncbi:MAG: hypothetical protein PHI86_03640 [Candidatus Omnitrophica bacterium]|nr:hypothetical protein [Candidatus Omnitrophota bacterium]HOX54255.1 hypothetical protein [Candidatus Omnitrophota bacterium]